MIAAVEEDFAGDEIGPWSEIKLSIVREYASTYSQILSARTNPSFEHVYIDAFCGAGVHRRKGTGEEVPGSPAIALEINPPFHEYHFIDIKRAKVEALRRLTSDRTNVFTHEGDCNEVLRKKVFPRVRYKDYRRALCLLDPYGMHLDWETVKEAAAMKSIEIVLHFPIGAMNRNVLKKNFDAIDPEDAAAMDRVWGDNSWKDTAYKDEPGLFGSMREKTPYHDVAEAFRERLCKVAGF